MPAERLERVMRLPGPPESIWPFFADPRNLETITPPWLRFRVLTSVAEPLGEGSLLDYRLTWRGLPIRWRTRIATWRPPHEFVDEQLRGPYRLWRHSHRFGRDGDGTIMTDRVEYLAPLSAVTHPLLIRRDVARIFDYRAEVLRRRLGGTLLTPSLSRDGEPRSSRPHESDPPA